MLRMHASASVGQFQKYLHDEFVHCQGQYVTPRREPQLTTGGGAALKEGSEACIFELIGFRL